MQYIVVLSTTTTKENKMNPLEILRKKMDEPSFALTLKLIEEGATWDWANFTNEAALEGQETDEGLCTYYVIVDFDEEDFETTPIFEARLYK